MSQGRDLESESILPSQIGNRKRGSEKEGERVRRHPLRKKAEKKEGTGGKKVWSKGIHKMGVIKCLWEVKRN